MKHLIFLAALGTSIFAQAQENLDSVWNNLQLHEVVVTGTRTPKFLSEAPIHTRVITSADIERRDATDIQDLLQQELPGIEFSYAMNQQRHMNFAGFGGQGVLFLVDGERLAGETMDDIDFSRITMSNVERIEIVKGASSALYGSNAVGGVVNIITKKAEKPWRMNVNSRWGRHGEQRYGATWALNRTYWSNTLTADFNTRDNYNVESADNPVTRVIATIYGDKVWNVKEQFTWKPGKDFDLTGRAGYFFRETERTADAPERYRDFSGGLRANWSISSNDHLLASYAFDQYDKSDLQRIAGLEVRDYSNVQNTFRTVFSHTFANNDVLTIGGDYAHDYLFNVNLTGDTREQDCVDFYAQYDWIPSEKLEVVGALRYDYFSDMDNSRLTPRINVRYSPIRNLNFRAGYGMGFRAPTLKEKYNNFDMSGIWIVEGNKNLSPEVSHNFNISAEYTKTGYNAAVSVYYNKVTDKLATAAPYFKNADDKLPYLPYTNLNDYRVYGGEVAVQKKWYNGVSAKMSYAYTHEELPKDKDGSSINNQYIPARAHALNVNAGYDYRFNSRYGLSANISGRVYSSVENEEYKNYYDISEGTVTVSYPAYSVWKLSLTGLLAGGIKVTAALDNILNYKPKYYYLNSPLTDGINLQLGISIDLDRL